MIVLAIFMILLGTGISYEPPELEYLNETEKELIMDEYVSIDINKFESFPIPAQEGDLLNYTIIVEDGGPIDFFILEEQKRDRLFDALNGSSTRIESYERGRGKNVTYGSSEFLLVSEQDWFVVINNYGHIEGGARPSSDVVVHIIIEKIGAKTSGSLSIG